MPRSSASRFGCANRALLAVACAVVALLLPEDGRALPPDAGVLKPGRSLGEVTIGMTRQRVLMHWGQGFGRCTTCARETLYFNRFAFRPEGTGVELADGRVSAVFTMWAPAGWSTTEGLRIGEPATRATATYPARQRVACDGYVALVLPGTPRSVIYVVSGEVWGFALLGRAAPVCR
jgi:hypothetical protein